MEKLTCSLLSCHCEARNQWLVAWEKSNWQFQKRAQQHWLSAMEANFWEMMQRGSGFVTFLVSETNHYDFMLEMLDTETRISTASSRIWMEQLTFSLPCCHCEARNQWLVAWDRSNSLEVNDHLKNVGWETPIFHNIWPWTTIFDIICADDRGEMHCAIAKSSCFMYRMYLTMHNRWNS